MSSKTFTVLDFETARGDRASICQVGIVIVKDLKIIDMISMYIQPPGNSYSERNIAVHGITAEYTESADTFDKVYEKIKGYIEGKDVVMHNASFDMSCLNQALSLYKLPWPAYSAFCTRKIYNASLPEACALNDIDYAGKHNAVEDAYSTALLMIKDIQGLSIKKK